MRAVVCLSAAAASVLLIGGCTGGEGSPTLAPPATSGPSPPTRPVQPSAVVLTVADLPGPGWSVGATTGITPAPCGVAFGITSGAEGHATVSFLAADNQGQVNETVATYPGSLAAGLVGTVRTAMASCAEVQALSTPRLVDDTVAVTVVDPAGFSDLVLLRSGSRVAWLVVSQRGSPIANGTLASVATRAASRLIG